MSKGGAPGRDDAQRARHGRTPAGHRQVSRPPRGRGVLRQRGHRGSARLHGRGPRRQRGEPHRRLCCSVDQPVPFSFVFAVSQADNRLVSVGRYALRGAGQPRHMFTVDQGAGGLQGLTVPFCLIVKLWESDCRKHDRRCRRRSPLEPSLGIPSALATLMAVPGIARAVSPLQR